MQWNEIMIKKFTFVFYFILFFSYCVYAQIDFPKKSVKIIVPVAPGAGTDFLARKIGEKLQIRWGYPVIIDNRIGGASGNVGAEFVARSTPDGYTLLVSGPGPLSINKVLFPRLSYNPENFSAISLIASIPNVLIVKPALPVSNMQDLVNYIRFHPGELNYASGGSGTTPHLSIELLKTLANLNIVHVPYKGSAATITAMLSGQIDMMFVELSSTLSNIKTGRFKAIAVGSEKRNDALPNTQTMNEIFPGFLTMTWYGLVAPPGTPKDICDKIFIAVSEILKQPDIISHLQALNIDIINGSPEEFRYFAKSETEKWGKVIKASGATVD
jgi:tripartite-type tricarboxylate transporter receptor subunit TctC